VSKEKNFLAVMAAGLASLVIFCGLGLAASNQSKSKPAEGQVAGCTATCGQIKEIYIPLGQGSAASQDWEEITGAEAVINLANFSGVKSVILEASLRIPTGNGRVYAKLYDVIAKHDVWFSEVSVEGSQSKREESAPVVLSPGRSLYRIKMKSTMGYEAILDQARLKILFQ